MLQIKDLSYTYDQKRVFQFPDFICEKGEHTLLLGQSGAGKTTLLHLLGGLLPLQKGEIHINNTLLSGLKGSAADAFRGKNIGIIFQKSHFVKSISVEENLLLSQQLAGNKTDKQRIKTLLERLNVGQHLHQQPDRLSIGEQQRVAIARALVNRPTVILADEPTSALDDLNTEEVLTLLTQQAEAEGSTLLVVTHDNRLKERISKKIELK